MKRFLTSLLLSLGLATSAYAEDDPSPHCPASDMLGAGIVSNVCWSCIFPIKLAGVTLFKSPMSKGGSESKPKKGIDDTKPPADADDPRLDTHGFALSSRPRVPSNAANKVACLCMEGATPHIGIPVGMWLPTTLYEATLVPGCSSTLAGTVMGITDPLYLGTSGDPEEDVEQQSFVHIHSFSYPVVMLMELFTRCNRTLNDIDMLYISEIDPMWNDPVIAMYGNPISVFGSSLLAVSACAADGISSAVGKPIDQLFWCGGNWTSTLSPYTGYQHNQGVMQYTSSAMLRLLAMNHVRGFERDTVGNHALCDDRYEPMVKRSNYRWQVAWPRAESRRNHASGETPLTWAHGRWIPGVADMPIYLQWKWIDCCTPLIGE